MPDFEHFALSRADRGRACLTALSVVMVTTSRTGCTTCRSSLSSYTYCHHHRQAKHKG